MVEHTDMSNRDRPTFINGVRYVEDALRRVGAAPLVTAHVCSTALNVKCVGGRLYDSSIRVARTSCTCACHDKSKKGAI